MRYFIYEGNSIGIEYYATKEEWQSAILEFDFQGIYCDDGWSEEVDNVIAGQIPDGIVWSEDVPDDEYIEEDDFYNKFKTHKTIQINKELRPDDVGDDGYSPDGEYWGEYEYKCGYAFKEIEVNNDKKRI